MQKVIVKFTNGEEQEGSVLFFNMNKSTFSLDVQKEGERSETHTIRTDNVKAIMFLKEDSEGGSHLHTETIEQSVSAGTVASKIVVEFEDGEMINGTTLKYNPNDPGFFLIPINPGDRSSRIYINAKAVKRIDHKKLLGKILVDQKKITPAQLEEALSRQKTEKKKKIGAILVEEAMIDEQQLQESLEAQRTKKKMIGEILIAEGYITEGQLDDALDLQQENKAIKLGQILVALKYVTPSDICVALASQLEYRWIDLANVVIPKDVVKILPGKVVRNLWVIPVEKRGENTIIVATSNPQDVELINKIKEHTTLDVELVIAYDGHLEAAIDYYFPQKTKK